MLELPAPRGELTELLLAALSRPVHPLLVPEVAAGADPLGDDDLQLALYLCYELHYHGLPGVADEWEWEPTLLALRRELEAVAARLPGVPFVRSLGLLGALEIDAPAAAWSRRMRAAKRTCRA